MADTANGKTTSIARSEGKIRQRAPRQMRRHVEEGSPGGRFVGWHASLAVLALFFPAQWLLQASGKTVPQRPESTARFVDVTRSAGLDFHLTCGGAEKLYIMESLCGGAAVFDYNNDGWQDIFFVNGATLEPLSPSRSPASSRLFRNNKNGTFTDATQQSGLAHRGWCMGSAVGDYDNDGWVDLYVTCFTGGALYRNRGDGTFQDVTAQAGVGNPGRWGTSAAFGDYDRDGNLDLYIANYVDLDLQNLPTFGSTPYCQYRGIPVSCGPRGLPGSRDRLYHNNGAGTFSDVTHSLAVDPQSYYGLGVIWTDIDLDGWPDIYVANDSSPSLLYRNNQGKSFTEVGLTAGVALSSDGREQAGMGVDSGDYDNDGWPDLVKTNFSDDTNNLYRNNQDGTFDDRAGAAGFGPVSIPYLGFGVRFFDYDNDGWRDIIVANGHVNPQVDAHSFGVSYAQRLLLFRNLRKGRLEEIGSRSGPAMILRRVSRGLAVLDFDNDGAMDVLLTNLDNSPTLLRNVVRGRGHWLRLKLIGSRSNRDALGARVEIHVQGLKLSDEVRANSSYVSASDSRLHFGLNSATRVDQIVIHWPSGLLEKIGAQSVDQELVIQEGSGIMSKHTAPVSRPIESRQR